MQLDTELILGNSNSRFSGVTSTMLQVLPHQQKFMPLAVMGKHHTPPSCPTLSFGQTLALCRSPLPSGLPRVFHARRNDEMLQALALRALGADIKIVFTSTAQRQHSRFTKQLMKRMDGIITTCAAANQYLHPPADTIIPHGIDTQHYHSAPDKAQAWATLGLPGKYGVGIFGRVRKQKGHDILIEAILPLFDTYSEPTLVIVGETKPNDQQFIDNLLHKAGQLGHADRIQVLGKQPFSKIPSLMRSMSAVCALSRNEGFGLTIPEAMASGVAVIASNEGAWEEIIREGIDGYVVPTADVISTRTALEKLFRSPSSMQSMGEQGRERITQDFTIQQEAQKLYNFYRSIQQQ